MLGRSAKAKIARLLGRPTMPFIVDAEEAALHYEPQFSKSWEQLDFASRTESLVLEPGLVSEGAQDEGPVLVEQDREKY